MPFSFKYKGLYRTAPDPGGYVKVARASGGRLEDSYAVAPLALGPYSGSVTGELPLFASRLHPHAGQALPRLQARRGGQDPHQLYARWL